MSDRGVDDDVGKRARQASTTRDGGGGGGASGSAGANAANAANAAAPRPKTQASILSFLTTTTSNKAARPSAEAAEAPVVLRRGAADPEEQQQPHPEVPLPPPLPPLPLVASTVAPPPPAPPTNYGPRLLPPLLDPYASTPNDAPQPPPQPPRLPPHRSDHLAWQLALAESGGRGGRAQLRRATPRLRVSSFWSGAQVAPGVGTPNTPEDGSGVVALRPVSATAGGRHDRLLAAQAGGTLRLLSWGALESAAAEALQARRERWEEVDGDGARNEEEEDGNHDENGGRSSSSDAEDDDGGGAWRRSSGSRGSTRARRRQASDEDSEPSERVAGGCARRRLRRSVRHSVRLAAAANNAPPAPPPALLLAQGRMPSSHDPQLFTADCSPVRPGLFAVAGSRGARLVAATEAGRILPLSSRPLGGFGGACSAPPADAQNPSPTARDVRFFPWQSAAGSYTLAVAVSHRRMPCVALHDARCVDGAGDGGGGGGGGGSGAAARPPCVTLLAPMTSGGSHGGLSQGEIVSLQVAPGGSLVYGASAAGAVFEWDVRRGAGAAGAGAAGAGAASSSSSSFLGGGGTGGAAMTFGAGGPSRHALVRAFDAYDLCWRAFGDGGGNGSGNAGALAAAARVPSRTSHVLLDPAAPWRLACVRDDRHVAVLDLRQGGAGQGHGRATHFASAEAPPMPAPLPTTTADTAVPASSSHGGGNGAGIGRIRQSCWDAAGDVLYTQGAVWRWRDPAAGGDGGGGGGLDGGGVSTSPEFGGEPTLMPALAALELSARMPHRRDAAAVRAPRGMAPQAARRLLSAPGVGGVAPAQWWRRGWQAVPDPVTCVAQRGDGSGALAVGTLGGEVVCVGHF